MPSEVDAPEEEFKPPPGDTGYVDLFAGDARGDEIAPEDPSVAAADDPFLAAARASLPEGFKMGGEAGRDPFLAARGSPDPFAEVEPEREPPAPPHPDPAPVRAPVAEPVRAVSPGAAPPRRPVLPAVLLGMGVGLVAVIALLVFTWSEPKAVRADPSPVSSRPAPAPADPSPEAEPREPASGGDPAPPLQAGRSLPKTEPRREEPKLRRKEPRVAQAPNVEREPSPLPAPPPPPEPAAAPKPKEPQTSPPELEGTLTPEVVNRVLAENRKAFISCIAKAGNSPDTNPDRKKVQLRLTINPNGVVTSPALDDAVLDSTELGGCLKAAARAMVFPRYKGNPFDAQIPLVLR